MFDDVPGMRFVHAFRCDGEGMDIDVVNDVDSGQALDVHAGPVGSVLVVATGDV